MIVSGGSKGDDGPKSTMNPVPLEEVWKVTVAPGFTQRREFAFALGKPGVAVAPLMPCRLTSTEHWPESVQVLSALHRLWGLRSAHTYLPLAWAFAMPASRQA